MLRERDRTRRWPHSTPGRRWFRPVAARSLRVKDRHGKGAEEKTPLELNAHLADSSNQTVEPA